MTVIAMNIDDAAKVHRQLFAKDLQHVRRMFSSGSTTIVRARGHLPQGCTTSEIRLSRLQFAGSDLTEKGHRVLNVCVDDSTSFLDLDVVSVELWHSDLHWVRALRLADDCHSYNVQLKLENGNLCVETVKAISDGQELVLWFSQDVLAIMQMGFLTLANIRGQKQYVCTKCSLQFETPNPLKLHITLQCNRKPLDTIWSRIVQKLTQCANEKSSTLSKFEFKLHPKIKVEPNTNENNFTLNDCIKNNSPAAIYRPFSEPPRNPSCTSSSSAFKPFKKETSLDFSNKTTTNNNSIKGSLSLCNIPAYWNETLWAPSPSSLAGGDAPLMHDVVVNTQAAHIEALVSSLGKSKQGHYCLYCGKCYSRKYGLKIHIRTHTGYKPLKCKYCSRPFGDPSNLNKHVRLHAEGDTPYRCELCNKVLVRRRDLERHLKSRHMNEMHPGSSTINVKDDDSDTGISEDDIII